MAGYLLDTTVLIDYLNGREHVVSLIKRLAREGHVLGLCPITAAEVYAGMRKKEEQGTDEFLRNLTYFDIDVGVAKKAGLHRSTQAKQAVTLTITDALIAAVAQENNLILLTANKDDYPIKELRIEEIPTHPR